MTIWIRVMFWLAAVYDTLLGLAFLVLGESLFERFDVPPPNHPGYYEFPALLLIIFGVLFAYIALNPVARRSLIWFGAALKASYCGVVFAHHFSGGVSSIWVTFAFADVGFLVLFVGAWIALGMIPTEDDRASFWD